MNLQTIASLFDRMISAASNAPSEDNNPEALARACWNALSDDARARVWEHFMGKPLAPEDAE